MGAPPPELQCELWISQLGMFAFANLVLRWWVGFLFGFFFLPPLKVEQQQGWMELEQHFCNYSMPLHFCQMLVGGLYIVIMGPIVFILPGMWWYKILLHWAGSIWHCTVIHVGAVVCKMIPSCCSSILYSLLVQMKWTTCLVPFLAWMSGWDKLLWYVHKQQALLFGSVLCVLLVEYSVCNKPLMSIHLILKDTVNNRFYFPPSPNCCIEFHSL